VFVDHQSFHFDDVDHVPENVLEEAEKREEAHYAKDSLGDADFKLVQAIHCLLNRLYGLLLLLEVGLMSFTLYFEFLL